MIEAHHVWVAIEISWITRAEEKALVFATKATLGQKGFGFRRLHSRSFCDESSDEAHSIFDSPRPL
jgi:hypothetical protein